MNLGALLLSLPVIAYRFFVSPVLGPRCRYAPSCSEFALEALQVHGVLKGSGMTLRRLLRCHPWGGSGYDPVPSCCRDRADADCDQDISPPGSLRPQARSRSLDLL
jgi:uncharacterized protein